MSHFMVGVLVPKETENIEAKVEQLLGPYNENTEVEPYDSRCFCVNLAARESGREAAETFKPLEKLRKEFHIIYPNGGSDQIWREFTKEYNKVEEEATKKHPLYEKPDPGCLECQGTGLVKSTYNPKSQWDWFVIGGRWDGVVHRAPRNDNQGGFNFGEEHHKVDNNIVLVSFE